MVGYVPACGLIATTTPVKGCRVCFAAPKTEDRPFGERSAVHPVPQRRCRVSEQNSPGTEQPPRVQPHQTRKRMGYGSDGSTASTELPPQAERGPTSTNDLAIYHRRGQPSSEMIPAISPRTLLHKKPRWLDPRTRIILPRDKPRAPTPPRGQEAVCWVSYSAGQHFANSCTVNLHEQGEWVKKNFEGLTAEQKVRVPWKFCVTLKGYFTERMRQPTSGIENPFSRTVPSAESMFTPPERSVSFSGKIEGGARQTG